MSKEHGFNKKDNNNLWEELAKGLGEMTVENTSETESELLQAGIIFKNIFDTFIEAGFSEKQAINLLAKIVAGGWINEI